jgi:hypothetical protein
MSSLLASQDLEIRMSFAGTSLTSSDSYSCQNQRKSLKHFAAQLRILSAHFRLCAILMLLSFLFFVATSSPHRVHHFGDAALSPRRLVHDHPEPHSHDRQQDHPAPSDQPAPHPHEGQPSPLPECVVLFLLQTVPILEAEPTLVAALEPQPLESWAHGCCPLDVHTNSTRIRAPPVVIL